MRLILPLLLIAARLAAQNGYGSSSIYDRTVDLPKGKHFFMIPPNGVWDKQPWKDSVYRYDSFQEGKLVMATGFTPSHRPLLNYNILLETIDIYQTTGVIVGLRKTNDIKEIYIGDHKFIYEPSFGYLEIILDGKISVGQRTFMSAIYEIGTGSKYPLIGTDIKSSPSKSTRYYWQTEQYYIVGENQRTYRSAPNVLTGMLPKIKKKIKAFAKENKIDYKNKEDLLKVVAYANDQASSDKPDN